MSLEKSELKKAVLNDVGADVEDMLESAQAQLAEHRGAKRSLRETAIKLGAVSKAIDDELDQGKLDAIGPEPLKLAAYAKQQVQRCIETLLGASKHEENLELASQGAISVTKAMMARVLKKVELETTKQQALAATDSEEAVSQRDRATGQRPAPSIAAQRKAEEATQGKIEDAYHDSVEKTQKKPAKGKKGAKPANGTHAR